MIFSSGMEAPTVIFLTKVFGAEPGSRSGLLRPVAKLVVITGSSATRRGRRLNGFQEDVRKALATDNELRAAYTVLEDLPPRRDLQETEMRSRDRQPGTEL